jgi:hypothetical protein
MEELHIHDDVSVVDQALEVTKTAFFSGKTRPVDFRIKHIKSLLRGLKKER